MSSCKPKLNLVVAVSSNMGIGFEGKLPWRIKGDMAFFKRITTTTVDSNLHNAVIMGRKTWESIPAKFRPLPDRINVIISTTMDPMNSDGARDCGSPPYYVVRGLNEALDLLSAGPPRLEHSVENIFVIGGSSIYEMALKSPYLYRIYLTEILKEFTCDTFLPPLDYKHLQTVQIPDVPTDMQIENDIQYKFIVHERLEQGVSNDLLLANDHGSITVKNAMNGSGDCQKPTLPLFISVATDSEMGFGKNATLPWESKVEFDHYISLVTKTEKPDAKVVFIKGRRTFEASTEYERKLPNTINIVVSSTIRSCPADVYRVHETFNAALQEATELVKNGTAEKIWLLGGVSIYKAGIESGLCSRIYLSRFNKSYDCDVFFPSFAHKYKLLTSCPADDELTYEIYEQI